MAMNTYYKEELYPLQDKVLAAINAINSPFYLTGGTALSRCYFNHRYSDDLDLFVNKDAAFVENAEKIIALLEKSHNIMINAKSKTFYSVQLDNKLKIDLVDDIAAHFGSLNKHAIYSKIDNPLNILSNKISAVISREEPKDAVDIWIVTKNIDIYWKQIFVDVASKAVGIFPPNVAAKLDTFPLELLEQIKWVEGAKPIKETFKKDIDKIISDILEVK